MSGLQDILGVFGGGARSRGGGTGAKTGSQYASELDQRFGAGSRVRGLLTPTGTDTQTANSRQAVNIALGEQLQEGFRFGEQADADRALALGQLEGNFDRLHQETLSEQDIQNIFARKTDAAQQGELADASELRALAGSMGNTGGGQLLAHRIRASDRRFNAIKGAKRDAKITRAITATEDRAREMQDRMALAQFQMSDRSMVPLDTLTNLTDIRFGQAGLEFGAQAARESAAATRSAGKDAKEGAIIGGALGLLGGIF